MYILIKFLHVYSANIYFTNINNGLRNNAKIETYSVKIEYSFVGHQLLPNLFYNLNVGNFISYNSFDYFSSKNNFE